MNHNVHMCMCREIKHVSTSCSLRLGAAGIVYMCTIQDGRCLWVGMGRVHCIKEAVLSPRAAPRTKNVEQYALYTLLYSTMHASMLPLDILSTLYVQATFERSVCKTQPVLAILLNVNWAKPHMSYKCQLSQTLTQVVSYLKIITTWQ